MAEQGRPTVERVNPPTASTASAEDDWPPRTPYYLFLGLDVVERVDGAALVRLPHRPELCNSRGEIHGGAQESLLDVALSQAIRSVLPPGSKVATISLTCSHLAAGHGSLTAHGRVVQAGRSVATAEGRVVDANETVVACAIGTYRVWRAAGSGTDSRPSTWSRSAAADAGPPRGFGGAGPETGTGPTEADQSSAAITDFTSGTGGSDSTPRASAT